MIWFTWRQFRAQAAVTALATVAFGIVLLVSSRSIAALYESVASCQSDCGPVREFFLGRIRAGGNGTVLQAAMAVMYVVPALIGVFWGAPLVAREFETGTHRLAWNQSVSRTRWLAMKLGLLGASAAVAAGLLSWAVTAWAQRIDSVTGDRVTPFVFGARGVVPIGYAVFAFVLGVAIGMVLRRTVAAMAATLAVYAAVAVAMPMWIRQHLVAAKHENVPLDLENLDELMINQNGEMSVIGNGVDRAWTVANDTLTAGGQVFTGPADPAFCARDIARPGQCSEWVGTLGLRQDLVYHPDSHFWALQWAETGVLLGLAALLAGFCFYWIRRRLI